MGIWIGLSLVIIAAAIYDRLSGRNFLFDTWTRAGLALRSLEDWDRKWNERQDKTQVVACLTTTPSRLPLLKATLKSLMNQQAAPERIRIHLPLFSKREKCPYEVPGWLEALRSVEVVRCDDYGPATKLIPALSAFSPDRLLLIVDDDMLYPPTVIADLLSSAEQNPDVAIGSSGWEVPNDLTDRPNTWKRHILKQPPAPILASVVRQPRRVDILQGYSGYLVKPRFYDLQEITDYSRSPPSAFFVDDVWIAAHCKVAKMVFPARRFCMDRWVGYNFFKRNSLGLINRGGGKPRERNNTIMIRHFADRWRRNNLKEPPVEARWPLQN